MEKFLLSLISIVFAVTSVRAEQVTANNISRFSQFRAGLPGDIVCKVTDNNRQLGRLEMNGRPSNIAIGASFAPLSPSVAAQEATLRKQMQTAYRGLKRPRSSVARTAAQKKIKQAQKNLSLLSAYTHWCNTFVPVSENPSFPNYPSQPPSGSQQPPSGSTGPDQQTRDFESFFIDDAGDGPTHTCTSDSVRGTISGSGGTLVTLANDVWIESQDASSGSFSFANVPEGSYTLVAESPGASFGAAHTVIVRNDASCETISLTRQELPDPDAYAFRWRMNSKLTSGIEQATVTHIPNDTNVSQVSMNERAGEHPSSQSSATSDLFARYKITLDSRDMTWGIEHAERLSSAISRVWPTTNEGFPITKPSSWILTSEYLLNDIELTESESEIRVRVTAEAFRYAALTPVELDGVRGQFFSERLAMAAARFITQDGRDRSTLEQILIQRFNVNIMDNLSQACWLTSSSTQECGESFQLFTNDELLRVMTALAQLTDRTNGWSPTLYLLRRRNGVPHPHRFDEAKIISYSGQYAPWPYIEFSREAFLDAEKKLRLDPTQNNKDILVPGVFAANAGIVWDQVLSQELRDAWTAQMEWQRTEDGKDWFNTNPTEVGAMLASGVIDSGPKGDFQTSVAKYIGYPEELRFRSPKRFEFLKLYVMHGLRYSRQFREDLKFKVLNLRPDFSYPGKVKEAATVVTGAETQDKRVRLKLTLEGSDVLEHGAATAYMVLKHEITGDRLDLGASAFQPDATYNASLRLVGDTYVSRYLPGGFYKLVSLTLTDAVGNTRFENGETFRFRVLLRNTLQPPAAAELIPDTLKLSMSETLVSGVKVPVFETEFRVTNAGNLRNVQEIILPTVGTRGLPAGYGSVRRKGDTVNITQPVSPFMPSDIYGLYGLYLNSIGRSLGYQFSLNPDSSSNYLPMPLVELENETGDVTKPEIDLNQIQLVATTLTPEKPNGATKVNIKIRARDDLAGVQYMTLCLRSPLDRHSCNYVSPPYGTVILPDGTTEWREYQTTVLLPAGSAPGTWGLDYITIADRVGNIDFIQLSEIVKFIVDNQAAE